MLNDRHVTTAITTEGREPARFSSVTFKVSVTAYGPTGPEAKANARAPINQIRAWLHGDLGEQAGVDKTRLDTSFEISPTTVYNEQRRVHEPNGYKAVYTATFTGTKPEGAIALHDELTAIEGVSAETPVFNIENTAELEEKAFARAWYEARRRFRDQCTTLDLEPKDHEVIRWDIEEKRRGGKGVSVEDEEGPKPGRADFILKVKFTFGPKRA